MVLIWDLSFGWIRVYQEVAACPDLLLPGTCGHIPGSCRRSRRFGATERPGIHCFRIRAFHNSTPHKHVHAQSDTQQGCSKNSPLLWYLWWEVSVDFRANDWFRLSVTCWDPCEVGCLQDNTPRLKQKSFSADSALHCCGFSFREGRCLWPRNLLSVLGCNLRFSGCML